MVPSVLLSIFDDFLVHSWYPGETDSALFFLLREAPHARANVSPYPLPAPPFLFPFFLFFFFMARRLRMELVVAGFHIFSFTTTLIRFLADW